jgi:DedD protein
MRSILEEEEELEPLHSQQDRELTLSSTTLLVIFFGLVLICGLFFGLGYSLGRRAPSESAEAPIAQESAPSPVATTQPKPSPLSPTIPTVTPAPEPAAADTQDSDSPKDASPEQHSATNPGVQPASEQTHPAAVKPVELAPVSQTAVKPALSATTPATTPSAGIMVQIAAVSNAADADVLINALRKRGYSVTVRNQPGDSFLHVQVGPFATRPEALAMKQKLLGDGYNAILK